MSKTKKQQAEQRGWVAESFCAWVLRLKGYHILERRFRTPLGEIDLIARRGKAIIFIEVKARKRVENALHAITRHHRERIGRAALLYLSHHQELCRYTCRFDVMVIKPWRIPYHFKNAWQLK